MYNLFLDDSREVKDCISYMHKRAGVDNYLYVSEEWIVVRNYDEFIKVIKEKGLPKLVSFDHDIAFDHYKLGFGTPEDMEEYYQNENREMTGYDCAKWLCDYCEQNKLPIPKYYVHSMNPTGVKNIVEYIERYKKYLEYE